MKVNPDKCHFLSSLDSNPKVSISSFDIENTNSQKFLGITIDCKLNFLNHVSNLCEKVDPKVGAMGRIFPLILLNQRKLIIKVILMSQFDYCLLLLINHNKTLNNWINSLHERTLWLVYNDFKSSFHQFLEKGNSVTFHECNLQTLAIELFKIHNNIAPELVKDVLEIKNHQYKFQRDACLQCRNVNTVLYGTETSAPLGSRIWNIVPRNLKCSISFNKFKKNIRKWTTKECPCCLCMYRT